MSVNMSVHTDTAVRAVRLGEYIIETGATVRQAAQVFGISKSTVHKDVTERLHTIDAGLHSQVSAVLARNKAERHLRGGDATRRKYLDTPGLHPHRRTGKSAVAKSSAGDKIRSSNRKA